jgi:hypothetical protein
MDNTEEKIKSMKELILKFLSKDKPLLCDDIVQRLKNIFSTEFSAHRYNRAIKELEDEGKIARKECLISL